MKLIKIILTLSLTVFLFGCGEEEKVNEEALDQFLNKVSETTAAIAREQERTNPAPTHTPQSENRVKGIIERNHIVYNCDNLEVIDAPLERKAIDREISRGHMALEEGEARFASILSQKNDRNSIYAFNTIKIACGLMTMEEAQKQDDERYYASIRSQVNAQRRGRRTASQSSTANASPAAEENPIIPSEPKPTNANIADDEDQRSAYSTGINKEDILNSNVYDPINAVLEGYFYSGTPKVVQWMMSGEGSCEKNNNTGMYTCFSNYRNGDEFVITLYLEDSHPVDELIITKLNDHSSHIVFQTYYNKMGSFSGSFNLYSLDGRVKLTSGEFISGRPEGNFDSYHANGRSHASFSYWQGGRDGEYTIQDSSGNVVEHGHCLEDVCTPANNGVTSSYPIAVTSSVDGYVNIRSKPNSQSEISDVLNNNEKLIVVNTVGNWYHVYSSNFPDLELGYVHKSQVIIK